MTTPYSAQPIAHDDSDNDDIPVGRLLTRREALTLLGGAGAAAITLGSGLTALAQTVTPTATTIPTCVVVPALTEGPYFVDGMLERVDIRLDPNDETATPRPGVPLGLTFRISDVSGGACAPLAGAQVDLWHCDAAGVYSGVSDRNGDTTDQLWLRGYQVTDEFGEAKFVTIYPGWYSGRTVHFHFKIRTDPGADSGYEFTSQLFFDEELSDAIYENAPYNTTRQRNTLNADDGIFAGSEGLLTLSFTEGLVGENEEEGLIAVFDIGLDLSAPVVEQGGMGRGRP